MGMLPRSERGFPVMLRRLTKFKSMVSVSSDKVASKSLQYGRLSHVPALPYTYRTSNQAQSLKPALWSGGNTDPRTLSWPSGN